MGKQGDHWRQKRNWWYNRDCAAATTENLLERQKGLLAAPHSIGTGANRQLAIVRAELRKRAPAVEASKE